MPKNSFLLAGIVISGVTVIMGRGDLATVSAQDNDRAANAPAANLSSDQIQTPDATKRRRTSPKADADIADEIVVSGIVLKPDGSPAAQATIRSMAPVPEQLESRLGRKFLDLAKMYWQATA